MFTRKNTGEAENNDINEAKENAIAVNTDTAVESDDGRQEPALRNDDFAARSVSYMGPGLRLTGDVTLEEGLVVEGVVEGRITTSDKSLTIGKQGRVSGTIVSHTIEVRGTVEGQIYGTERVRLYSSAVVEGNIYCKRLVMDDGATFNGNIDMTWDGTVEESLDNDDAQEKVALASIDGGAPAAKAAG